MPVLAELTVSDHIKQHMLQLKQTGELELEGIQIASRQVVPKLYERRDYLPVWSNADSVQQLFKQIRLAYDEGLNPNDYHLDKLKSLQLQLKQTPGPHNALGQVKFIFPNKHFVFIHDTPSRSFYDRSTRTFSSGCIRVENPLKLAELLLEEKPDWDRTRINKVIAAGKTKRVNLKQKTPVLLFYWTVTIEEDDSVRFKEDPYGRDARVLASLDGKFKLRKRDLKPLEGL